MEYTTDDFRKDVEENISKIDGDLRCQTFIKIAQGDINDEVREYYCREFPQIASDIDEIFLPILFVTKTCLPRKACTANAAI